MNEGVALSSAKIDPTWYGCLPVAITNNSLSTFNLRHGQPICTILVFQLHKPIKTSHYLSRQRTPHLGRSTLDYEPIHASPWQPKRPDTVRDEDMDKAVDFGPPFDVIRGMFDWNQKKIIDYMEKQWGTNALRQLKHSAWEEEFQQIKEYREREISLLQDQIQILRDQGEAARKDRKTQFTLALTLIIALLGWIGTGAAAVVLKLLEGPGSAASGG